MFFLELPVKPYVKQYIILNYGNPANFSTNKYINDRFRKCLSKPSRRWDNKYEKLAFAKQSESIKITLSQDDFYRYGWELSPNDIISFGKLMEHQAKFLMRNMVSFYMSLMNERNAILTFQSKFGFTEDIWPFDSIKKSYSRSVNKDAKFIYSKDLSVKLENLLLTNLSDVGNMLPSARIHYETH
ncbi:MAG: hypothetical protein ACOYN4_04510 [Bacteroidales bacterium]